MSSQRRGRERGWQTPHRSGSEPTASALLHRAFRVKTCVCRGYQQVFPREDKVAVDQGHLWRRDEVGGHDVVGVKIYTKLQVEALTSGTAGATADYDPSEESPQSGKSLSSALRFSPGWGATVGFGR